MNEEQHVVERGPACGAACAVSSDDWQSLEWQLMALVLETEEEGARS